MPSGSVTTTYPLLDLGGGVTVGTVQVTVQYRHPWFLLGPMLGLINRTWGSTIILTATSQMRKEG